MFKISRTIAQCMKNSYVQPPLMRLSGLTTSASIAEAKNPAGTAFEAESSEEPPIAKKQPNLRPSNKIVAAAFASLHAEETTVSTPLTDNKITKAKSVNELLSISADKDGVSRRHAFKVVSVLSDWYTSGKVQLADFETDSRFLKLCRILSKGLNWKQNRPIVARSEDLSTILGITADDEAAKLVVNMSLSQMVKVMTTLSQKKRRSPLLLRSLSYNIAASCEKLNLKDAANLMYSMSSLNFVDDNLLTKVSGDICSTLPGAELETSSVVGSIITSVGFLRYKNLELLESLSNWMLENQDICRLQDISTLFMTLAIVNYLPSNSEQLFKVLMPQLKVSEMPNPVAWVNVVWSFVLLQQATPQHISSVLEPSFFSKVEGNQAFSTATKLKLLNIRAAAKHLIKDYEGPSLAPGSSVFTVDIGKSRGKIHMVDTVVDSLRNLILPENFLRTDVDTGAGFYIDAECLLDNKCHPLPLDKSTKPESGAVRVAILVHDYHDMCRDHIEPHGVNCFARRLLEAQNYKVVVVPYTEFKATDKLVQRVQYLEAKLKEAVK